MRHLLLAVALFTLISSAGCATAPDTATTATDPATKTPPEKHPLLIKQAKLTLDDFKTTNPAAYEAYTKASAGYLVFPDLGKAGANTGQTHGMGVLFEGGDLAGYCKTHETKQLGFQLSERELALIRGAQLGGHEISVILFFENEAALKRFKSAAARFDPSASAVISEAYASATADFKQGLATAAFAVTGPANQAIIVGKRFEFVSKNTKDK